MPRWIKALQQRLRRILGVLALVAISAALLIWARLSEGFTRDVLVNIGASVVIVAMSYAIFDPLFQELRRSRVEERPSFDSDKFSRSVSAATDLIAVMDTGNHILEGGLNRERFLSGVRAGLRNGARVRIMLLDPDSAAARQRAEEIHPVDVRGVIVDNLRHLHQFAKEIQGPSRSLFEVRIYDASPSVQMFRWDDRALISFFPIGVRASASPHLEVQMSSTIGEFVQGRFDDLWHHLSTRNLADYIALPLTVLRDGEVLAACVVDHVWLEEAPIIDATPIMEHLADYGISSLTVAVEANSISGRSVPELLFRLSRLDNHTVPVRSAVDPLFDEKYGRHEADNHIRLLMRLVEREQMPADPAGID